MKRRILWSLLPGFGLLILSACGGEGVPPGAGGSTAVNGGKLTVQLTQPPPTLMTAGQSTGLFATVFNDKNNAGVSWSCSPANACGTFTPTTTGYQIDTLYTAPVAAPNGAITPNLVYTVTVTATSVADSSQSASTTLNVAQRYTFVLQGYASLGMAGTLILDGQGNVIDGEAEGSANGFYSTVGRLNPGTNGGALTGTYSLDSTGHGSLTLNLNTSCCGTFTQTHSLTATSNSHLVMSEIDQFNGLTIGGEGSLDLQTAGPVFSASQVSGSYSFTLTGFSGNAGLNGNWAGIFTADGVGALSGGILDSNLVGTNGKEGSTSTSFTGAFSAPDTFGHGTLTFSGVEGGSDATYSYYIVTPEVLRLTSGNQSSANYSGNTGSAFGQGSVATTDAALNGNYIFSLLGFDVPGDAVGGAGQFAADGNGSLADGIMDLNDSGNAGNLILGLPFSGSYSISGSARGTATGPSGQTYNVYLTDPTINLLDPNNSSGAGGALLLETDATFSTIGLAIPQASPSTATLNSGYAMLLSDQNNPPMSDGGFTGSLSASAGTFTGEGDFETQNTVDPITGPLTGTYVADPNNPGRFTGTITTNPSFPAGGAAGTENVSYYLANGSQGFIVETDTVAPIWGVVESQGTIQTAAHKAARPHAIKRMKGPKPPSASR